MTYRPVAILSIGIFGLIASTMAGMPVGAAGASGTPTIKLSPHLDLTPGQAIDISGTGFTPKHEIELLECPVALVDPESTCLNNKVIVYATREGWFPSTSFTVMSIPSGPYKCGTNNKDRNNCAIYAYSTGSGPSASALIHFAKTS
jgi:hypothetical protein